MNSYKKLKKVVVTLRWVYEDMRMFIKLNEAFYFFLEKDFENFPYIFLCWTFIPSLGSSIGLTMVAQSD